MRHLLLGMMLALIAVTALAGPGRAQSAADIVFSEVERRLILEYFGHPPKGAPGGKGMPPGLAKQGKLPPGIAKKALPADLLRRLPAPLRGDKALFEIVKYGGQPFSPRGYRNDMPGYEHRLGDAEIWAVIAYMHKQWPESVHAERRPLNR